MSSYQHDQEAPYRAAERLRAQQGAEPLATSMSEPALRVAVHAVLELHSPEDTEFYATAADEQGRPVHETRTTCSHCNTGDPYSTVSQDWPCPTVAAIRSAGAGTA